METADSANPRNVITKKRRLIAIDREARGLSSGLSRDHPWNWDYFALVELGCCSTTLCVDFDLKTGEAVDWRFEDDNGGSEQKSWVFPTPLTDEEWRKVPASASEWWEKNPELLARLEELKKLGHVVLKPHADGTMPAEYLTIAREVVDWFIKAGKINGVYPVICTDTQTADVQSLNSIFTYAGHPALNYSDDMEFGSYMIFDYSQFKKFAASIRYSARDTIAVVNMAADRALEKAGVKHDHKAINDARHHLEQTKSLLWHSYTNSRGPQAIADFFKIKFVD